MNGKLNEWEEHFVGDTVEDFARRLHLCKGLFGLNNRRLARAIGVSEGPVHAWAAGKCFPKRVIDVVALARLFGTSTDWVLTGRGDGPQAPQS